MFLQKASRMNHNKNRCLINRLQKRILGYKKTLVLFPDASDLRSLLSKEELTLQNLIDEHSLKWQVRSKAKWTEKGEKSTKYFYSRFMTRLFYSPSELVKDPDSPMPLNKLQTLDYMASWHEKSFIREPIVMKETYSLLRNTIPFSFEETCLLMKPFTQDLVQSTINFLLNSKSPGLNSISYEYYKKSSPWLTKHLTILFNQCLDSGQVPPSWTKSFISLIPKKEKDKNKVQNWRPIALINTDAKIFLKLLAVRLGAIAGNHLPQHQKGFLPTRNVVDATLNVLEMAHVLKGVDDLPTFLLQLDQQKAYDRVDHDYLGLVMAHFNLPQKFITLVMNIFTNQTANITDNKNLSRSFKMERGVRQGDPLSPILFDLAIEPLLASLSALS